ncbi:MAG: FecR domain-containing protein [Deltaproteobacteria bacterium]|nr:FecR domain-containing protein [Deltaproteobacteria bacterium]
MNKRQTIINSVSISLLIFTWHSTLYGASSIGKAIELFGKKEELKYTRQAQTEFLMVNTPLYYNDGILTGSNSSTRLLVEDPASKIKAAFYVFEDSKFTLDKEVVETSGKKITVKHTQGALSVFVKGLKKGDEVQIVTPQGTLGVRGTGLFLKLVQGHLFVTLAMGKVYLGNVRLMSGREYQIDGGKIMGEKPSSFVPELDGNMWAAGAIPLSHKRAYGDHSSHKAAEERLDTGELAPE